MVDDDVRARVEREVARQQRRKDLLAGPAGLGLQNNKYKSGWRLECKTMSVRATAVAPRNHVAAVIGTKYGIEGESRLSERFLEQRKRGDRKELEALWDKIGARRALVSEERKFIELHGLSYFNSVLKTYRANLGH